MAERVVIVALGACTPVGRDAWSSAAAVRAGISGFVQHPYMIDTAGEPMRAAIAPWIDIGLSGADRLEALLFPALDQALEPLASHQGAPLNMAIALGLPSARPGLPEDIQRQMLARINKRYARHFSSAASFAAGHAAGLIATQAAFAKLMQGTFDACVVAGVDSYIEPLTLEWLEANDQLHSAGPLNNAWGFIPGEAGAALLLMRESVAQAAGLEVLAVVLGTGSAMEPKRIKTETVTYASPAGSGTMKGYLALPANPSGKLPGVLVIHENRGVNPHIEDIARRLAVDNFIAFAPDALTPLGGFSGDEEKAAALFRTLDQAKTREDFVAGVAVLKSRPEFNGKYGATGFCYGGGIVHMLATRLPDLAAGVPFYGNVPAVEEAVRVKAALLMHFAGVDERINAAWPAYEAALKAAGVRHTAYQYAGTGHGFNNDTTPRFDAAAAKLAWDRTITFFNQTLRA